jgi:membrane protein implicated in regulation of membrane protease activity
VTICQISYHSFLLYTLQSTIYNQTVQAAGLAVTVLPKFPLSFPVLTTLATPLVGVGVELVAAILAVILEILSTTFSLATIEPFTAPAITPAMIRRIKIDRQIVHLMSASLSFVIIWLLYLYCRNPVSSSFNHGENRSRGRAEESRERRVEE